MPWTEAHTATAPGQQPTGVEQRLPLRLRGRDILAGEGSSPVLSGLHPRVTVTEEAGGGLLLGASVDAPVSSVDIPLGQLHIDRFLACARCKLWWMTPEWGSCAAELPPETQFLLAQAAPGGPYLLLLPLIDGGNFRAVLRPPSQADRSTPGGADTLTLRVESGCSTVMGSSWERVLYASASQDPFALVQEGVALAARLSGGARPLAEKQIPDSVNYFGWCTWDAFYSHVSAKGVSEGLSSLDSGGVCPRWLIIDDGWQLTDVDDEFRSPPTAKLLRDLRLVLPEAHKLVQSDAEATMGQYREAELEVLGKAARNVPQSSSAGSVLEEVSSIDDQRRGNHSAVQQRHSSSTVEEEGGVGDLVPAEQRFWLIRVLTSLLQRLLGALAGLGEVAILTFYTQIVEPAPPGSWPVRFFTWLTAGPARGAMLSFYADSGNFTRRLLSVAANGKFAEPDAGPDHFFTGKEGLGKVVRHLRERFGLQYVYVWHGLPAYWSGVATPEAVQVGKYKAEVLYATPTEGLLELEPSMAWNPSVIAGIGVVQDPAALYRDMHAYLLAAGIDGVKVDCQAGVGLIGTATDGGPASALRYHMALEDSVATHFKGNHMMNCMCHSTENIYRFRDTAVARASDDFYPREPASFTPHVAACAYNGLFLAPLVLPDWDMFQSKHPAALLHACARAVSGAAVYVSDRVGEHDVALLRRLVLPDGSVLRALQPARPTRDCLFADVMRDGHTLLKVWNINRCNGVVGVFNLQGAAWDRRRRRFHAHSAKPRLLRTTVYPSDIEPFAASASGGKAHGDNGSSANGAHGGESNGAGEAAWAAFECQSRQLSIVREGQGVEVELPGSAGTIVTLAPLQRSGGVAFAALGLSAMLNGGGAVESCGEREPGAGGGAVGVGWAVRVRGTGELLMYCSVRPAVVQLDGDAVRYEYDSDIGALTVQLSEGTALRHEVFVMC